MFEFISPTAAEPTAPFPFEIACTVHLPIGMDIADLALLAETRRERERLAERDAELAALTSWPPARRPGQTPQGYYRQCVSQRVQRQPYHALYRALRAQRRCDYSELCADWQPVADFTVPYDPTLRYVLELHRQDAHRGRVVVINTVAAQYTRPARRPRSTIYPDSWRACVRRFLAAAED